MFNISTHLQRCKKQITTTNPYSNLYLMSECALFLSLLYFIGHLVRVLRGNLNVSYSFVFVCLYIYVYWLLFPHRLLSFYLPSYMIFPGFFSLIYFSHVNLHVIWISYRTHTDLSECAVPHAHFLIKWVLLIFLFNYKRLNQSMNTFFPKHNWTYWLD
jgi:hypothetical protein